MRIRLSVTYVVAFLALTILCGTSHEFAHHFVGALLCRCFGTKTFNSFDLCRSCAGNDVAFAAANWAGPLLTYGLMWLGVARMLRPDESSKQLGFALVFANFPINRIGFALLDMNDEQFVTAHFFGTSSLAFWITNAVIWLFAIPPLIVACRAIRNPLRPLWFLGFFILPFAFVFVFAGLFLENWLLLEHKGLATPVLGVPYLIVVVEIACLILFISFRRGITQPSGHASA
jgi:hypothetical protein